MHHVAIMKKSWNLLPKILSGEKIIESRWYKIRSEAWGKVKAGDTVYFKNSGEEVTVKAKVSRVMQFGDLTPAKVKKIIGIYGKNIGIDLLHLHAFKGARASWVKNKKYCVLIFLDSPKPVEPFKINKTGFGLARAFLTVRNIEEITQPGR